MLSSLPLIDSDHRFYGEDVIEYDRHCFLRLSYDVVHGCTRKVPPFFSFLPLSTSFLLFFLHPIHMYIRDVVHGVYLVT